MFAHPASPSVLRHSARLFVGAVLLAAGSVLVPQRVQAQTIRAEEALLNQRSGVTAGTATDPGTAATVDGAWALLGHAAAGTPAPPMATSGSSDADHLLDGEQALLNPPARYGSRRLSLN